MTQRTAAGQAVAGVLNPDRPAYIRFLYALVADALRFLGPAIARLYAWTLLSLIAGVTGFALLLGYLRAQLHGESIRAHVGPLSVDVVLAAPIGATTSLLLVAVICAALILTAFAAFRATVGSLNVARRYEQLCVHRAILAGARSADATEGADRPTGAALLAAPRWCARALLLLVRVTRESFIVVVSAAIIFVLSPVLSGLILATLAVSVSFLYRANLEAIRHARTLDRTARPSMARKRLLMAETSASPDARADELLVRVTEDPDIEGNLAAFIGRFVSVQRAALVTGIAGALILAQIALTVGAIEPGSLLAVDLLAYVGALRFFLNSVTQVAVGVTKLSRFYLRVLAFFELLAGAADPAAYRLLAEDSIEQELPGDDELA